MRKPGWLSMLLWPVTVPAGFFGIVYFVVMRRHPPAWLLITFGAVIAGAIAWTIGSLAWRLVS